MASVKQYYQLTKPGIVQGNLLTAAAGFLLAADWRIDFVKFAGLLAGTGLVIAAACVFNNYIDRGIDAKMARTKQRALVSGTISGRAALTYGVVLGALGIASLALYTNGLTLVIGLIALFDYVVLYGWSKRQSVYGTLVGSVSGSAPIVAGYTAVTGRFDTGALLLFLILTCWQMPHFYSIALYRYKDYKKAGLPVLPVARSVEAAQRQTLAYIVLFLAAVTALTAFGYTGELYLAVMLPLGVAWFWKGMVGLKNRDSVSWGRDMFLFSLIVIAGLSLMTAVGSWLP